MFIHFGGKKWASLREIVGIFTIDAVRDSAINQEYLRHVDKGRNRDLEGISSMIILEDKEIFCSPICSLTLIKRVQEMDKSISSTICGVMNHEA